MTRKIWAVMLLVATGIPQVASADPVTLEGKVNVFSSDDFENKSSKRSYELETNTRQFYRLEFGDAIPVLRPNQRVRVQGERNNKVVQVVVVELLD